MNKKEITKTALRYLITFLCTAPFLVGLGLLLENKIADIVMIIMFAVIAGGVIVIEELIHSKLYQRRQKIKEARKANFKSEEKSKDNNKEENQKTEENLQKNDKKAIKKHKK